MLFASGDESPSSTEKEDRKGMGARRKGLDGTLEQQSNTVLAEE